MRILIDLGHPAHIHYFKHFIWQMEAKGHEFILVARDKEVLYRLLDGYGFSYVKRGKGGKSFVAKLFYILKADYIIFRVAMKFKPDLFLSFASAYAAHAAWLYRKPHIVFDDTEHAKFELMLYAPFSETILNPKPFWKTYSKNQLYFDGYMELTHLAPNYFKPDPEILKQYGIDATEKFFIVRFVSWDASHDMGQTGLTLSQKEKVVELLQQHGRVLISSESKLPQQLEGYKIKINPVHLHHFLAYAQLYIGEGATTAAESIILGTPAIYINTLDAGTISEQAEKYGLISLRKSDQVISIIQNLLQTDYKQKARENRDSLLNDKIDVTAFMVWLLNDYPKNKWVLKNNPAIQYQFKIKE